MFETVWMHFSCPIASWQTQEQIILFPIVQCTLCKYLVNKSSYITFYVLFTAITGSCLSLSLFTLFYFLFFFFLSCTKKRVPSSRVPFLPLPYFYFYYFIYRTPLRSINKQLKVLIFRVFFIL